ncbi:MAG: biotin/lipoyl-containing protein [Negativicutes bacterium]
MKTVKAPLDGYLDSLNVSVGDCVQKGQILAVVLILKMDNPVLCDRDGVVKEVYVKKKSRVKYGQPLLRIE